MRCLPQESVRRAVAAGAGGSLLLSEWNSTIQPSAAKPQPKERGSVTRRGFAGRPAFLQIQRVRRSQRAAAHRAALRKSGAARVDLDSS